jgi:putative aminopeptidase FrvX
MNTNDVKNSDVQNTESTEKVSTDVKKDVKETTTVTTTNEVEKKDENALSLTHLDEKFVYELMSVPTSSSNEYRLVTFIILWARRNNIHYEFDDYGNVYLTKGEIKEGEYYPCVTAHLDSVQSKQKTYAQAGQPLQVKTRISTISKKHEIFVDGMGIGGDDKAGVLIGLSMFSHLDTLKACFFLEEEIGCKGSAKLNKEWFKDVGYVMGFDSPDLNRAAYACSGVKLFSANFFKTYMQDICKKHGLTKFQSEPFTDVKEIREQTGIMCMNFGSGYYNAHSEREYCVIEDMDTACRMGVELIEFIGLTKHELEHKSTSSAWIKMADGSYKKPEEDKDEAFFRTLSGYGSYTYPSVPAKTTSSTTNVTKVTSATTSQNTSTSQNKEVNKDVVEIETLEYISTRYEEQISLIKENIQNICKENNIDFEKFAKVFDFEIKF